jgi:hypothetical protein
MSALDTCRKKPTSLHQRLLRDFNQRAIPPGSFEIPARIAGRKKI